MSFVRAAFAVSVASSFAFAAGCGNGGTAIDKSTVPHVTAGTTVDRPPNPGEVKFSCSVSLGAGLLEYASSFDTLTLIDPNTRATTSYTRAGAAPGGKPAYGDWERPTTVVEEDANATADQARYQFKAVAGLHLQDGIAVVSTKCSSVLGNAEASAVATITMTDSVINVFDNVKDERFIYAMPPSGDGGASDGAP